MTRSIEEIRDAFEVQRSALRRSCEGYDAGELWESLRLATVVYTLVHDGGRNSQSILSQLGVKKSLEYLSTAKNPIVGNLIPEPLLVFHELEFGPGATGEARCVPMLDESDDKNLVRFSDWWDKEAIYKNGPQTLSRRELVFSLRNQEGGSHFDPLLTNAAYIEFAKDKSLKLIANIFGEDKGAIMGQELASMRQIAWELDQTFRLAMGPRLP